MEARIHWNLSFVGGVLGVYAILLHMGNFGSAQTGNLMEMADSLISGEWQDVLLRFLALPCFGAGVVAAYLLSNDTKVNMRKLSIILNAGSIADSVKAGYGWSVSDFFLLGISMGIIFSCKWI